MAIKYVRESKADQALDGRSTPFQRAGRAGRWPIRKKLTVIYIGILVMSVLAFTSSLLVQKGSFRGQPVVRGVGVVEEKASRSGPNGETLHFLRLRVPLDSDRWAEDEADIDAEHWAGFSEGDRVGILYQISRDGGAVRIRECGLVALDQPMR